MWSESADRGTLDGIPGPGRRFPSDAALAAHAGVALHRWLMSCNQRRPHTALDGSSPMSDLVSKVGANHN